jgi:MarR family transcriptional regulator, lower aerobic nicotinate degradation pathway regulator
LQDSRVGWIQESAEFKVGTGAASKIALSQGSTLPSMNAKSAGTPLVAGSMFELDRAPGHLIRRAHQRAVAAFSAGTAGTDITPIQFAILTTLLKTQGMDQATLAAQLALDAATSGSVIGRLERKGLLRRTQDTQDKRRRLLWLTPAGAEIGQSMAGPVERLEAGILGVLQAGEQQELMRLLSKLVHALEQDHEKPRTQASATSRTIKQRAAGATGARQSSSGSPT